MKKILSLLLVIVMICSFASCAKKSKESNNSSDSSQADDPSTSFDEDDDNNNTQNNSGENEQNDPEDNTPGSDVNDDPNISDDPSINDNPDISDDPEISDNSPTVFPKSVCNNNECTIEITSVNEKDEAGYLLNISASNKTSNKTLFFEITNAAINGIQCDTFFYIELEPNKNATEIVHVSVDKLKEYNIDVYTDIQLSFKVYDAENFLQEYATETIHIYPYGKDKVVKFERTPLTTDSVIFENNNVSLTVINYDNSTEPLINIYATNKTDKDLVFTAHNVYVNDCALDPFFNTDVPAGCSAFDVISWTRTEFSENGITKINKVEMIFNVYDSSYRDIIEERIIFYFN